VGIVALSCSHIRLTADGNIGDTFRVVATAKRRLVSCGIDRSRVSCRMRHAGRRIPSRLAWSQGGSRAQHGSSTVDISSTHASSDYMV